MQMLKKNWVAFSLASGCAAALSGTAYADDESAPLYLVEWNMQAPPPAEAPAGFPGWVAVDSTMLEQMRGGFDIAPGLRVSFGIERLVNLNGVLQTATRIEVPDAGKLRQPSPLPATSTPTGSPASITPATITTPVAAADANSPPPAANSAAGLVQNGLGNQFSPAALSQGAVGTFIQNSVNNQTIQSLTIINATTNSLELLKGANLQSTLFDALTQSAGAR